MENPNRRDDLCELIRQAQAGDGLVREECFRQFAQMVKRFVRKFLRRRDRRIGCDDADDLTQEALKKVNDGFPKLEAVTEQQVVKWVETVTQKSCFDRDDYYNADKRNAKRTKHHASGSLFDAADARIDPGWRRTAPHPLEEIARRDDCRIIEAFIEGLKGTDRKFAKAVFIEGLSLCEAVKRLGIEPRKAKDLHREMRLCLDLLVGRD